MPWCYCKKNPTVTCDSETCASESSTSSSNSFEDLEKMKQTLMKKEKELLKKCQKFNKKIKNFDKHRRQKESNDRLTKKKLKLAHKRIEQALGKKSCDCRLANRKNFKSYKVTTKQNKKYSAKPKKENKKPKKKNKDFHSKVHKFLTAFYEKPILYSLDTCQNKQISSIGNPTDSFFSKCIYNPWAYQFRGSYKNPFAISCPCRCRNLKDINVERKSAMRSAAGDCFLMSMRKTPQLWIYDRWPGLYTPYLSARSQCNSLSRCFLFFLAALFWSPCLLCLALCKCCFCACGHDGC